ncbi:MAG: hypothetical protein PHU23_09705 [Dehalococcoidales bacterium]|nr:hypothetical protein [Dehalococcoidales bacterium]
MPLTAVDKDIVIRTDPGLDNMVKHLGYRSIQLSGSDLDRALISDRELIRISQDRLRGVKIIPDDKLDYQSHAHLKLARALAAKLFTIPPQVHIALIPPASDRVNTAGMYSTITGEIYISLETARHFQTMIDTLIHEFGHHRQVVVYGKAEDLIPEHASCMRVIAEKVISIVGSGELDPLLEEVIWS